MDKAYRHGVSGGTAWQRLWEGTRLQNWFGFVPGHDYDVLLENMSDEESRGSSGDGELIEQELESAWVKDLGATWTTKEC